MLLTSEQDLVMLLGIIAAVLLTIALGAGIIAALKAYQVKQFQDMLFKAERKIDNLERRMFNVLNAVPVALVETDAQGRFTFANRAAHQLMGRKDNELVGLRFHSATWGITYPDNRTIPADLLPTARALRGQTVKGFQHMMVNHQSKEKLLVSVSSMPIVSTNGEVTGTSSALVELETEQGQGVGDLTGLWRGQWFAESPLPFFGLDSAGRILDVNAAACEAFDFRREQMLSQTFADALASDDDFKAVIDFLGSAYDKPGLQPTSIVRLKSFDGVSRPYLVSAWTARTSDHGEKGLTLLAISDGIADAIPSAFVAPSTLTMPDQTVRLELEERRHSERTRETLGLGLWRYDMATGSVIEDTAMRRLIGRDVLNGPSRITPEDSARSQAELDRLISGEMAEMKLTLTVPNETGVPRQLSLQGRSEVSADGTRNIVGFAVDVTDLMAEQTPASAYVFTPTDDSATAPLHTRITQLETQLNDAAASREAVLANLEDTLSEQAKLKATISQLSADLEAALNTRDHIKDEQVSLSQNLNALVAEKARLEQELADLKSAPAEEPVMDTSPWEARIAELEQTVTRWQNAYQDAQSRLSDLQQEKSQLALALDEAQTHEDTGRAFMGAVPDFTHTLTVVNDVLEMLNRQPDNAEQVRRLSQAALSAGRYMNRQLETLKQTNGI